jgi:glycosyltransferase involved in cell wall biosynthesis
MDLNGPAPRTAIVLFSERRPGGTERRIARAYSVLEAKLPGSFLVINRDLFDGLREHGVPVDQWPNVVVIPGFRGSMQQNRLFRAIFIVMAAATIRAVIRKYDLRTLHIALAWPYISLLAAVGQRIRIGMSIVSNEIDMHYGWAVSKLVFRWFVRRCDFIDLLSPTIRDRFEKEFPPGPGRSARLTVAPCSFSDYGTFRASAQKRNVVVSISRLIPIKNIDVFVRAVALLDAEPNGLPEDLRFKILGSGPLEAELRRLAADLAVSERILFGYAERPEEHFGESSVFVSLQNVTNYPSQSLIEAMACENAIVATDVGETWRLVDEKTGVRVRLEAGEVARAIRELFSDQVRMRELGRSARGRVVAEQTAERFVEYMIDELYAAREV